MHRITGDGYDVQGGKNLYGAENLPTRNATQVTHMAMNAIQEEIAKVIEVEGGTLNAATEDPLTDMHQLSDAIDNKIKAPRGYIDGFEMYSNGGPTLYMNRGVALDEAGVKWIRKTTDFNKLVNNGGNLNVWVAGGGNGSVKSGEGTWWNTVVGQWTGGTNEITGITSTAGMLVGDLLYAAADVTKFGHSWGRITEVTPTAIKVDRTLPASGTSITLTNIGRWFHVWAIGKSSDPAAFDVVLTTDIDALAGAGFGAFDIYRRLGSVWVKNIAGNPAIHEFNQYGDEFYWAADNPETSTAYSVGGTVAAGDKTIKACVPRQVNVRARMAFEIRLLAQPGKYLTVVPKDGGNYGNSTVRGRVLLYPDAAYDQFPTMEMEFNTGLNSEIILNCDGGSSTKATASFWTRTMSWIDRRGKR